MVTEELLSFPGKVLVVSCCISGSDGDVMVDGQLLGPADTFPSLGAVTGVAGVTISVPRDCVGKMTSQIAFPDETGDTGVGGTACAT
jgi:hypothetical protein